MMNFLRRVYDRLMFRPHPEHGVIRQLEGERQWWLLMFVLSNILWVGLIILISAQAVAHSCE